MAPTPRLTLPVLLAAVCAVLAAPAARAADEALALRQRAEQLAAQERCDEALPRARRAHELDPGDARALLVIGRCQMRQAEYAEAIPALQAARELDPALPGVATDLAQCHYHLDQLEAARTELDRAEDQDPDDARMHLYRGLVLLRDAQLDEAARSFDRAGRLDSSVSEVASLYAGRTWASVRERERAAEALKRAREADPDSEWARAAESELAVLEKPYLKNSWARVRGGVEYDDNVALRIPGGATDLNAQFFGQFAFDERSDVRAIYEGEIGTELWRDPDNSAGIIAGFEGSNHFKRFHEFDLQYPWVSLWYDRRLGEATWLRLQPFGGYSWLETDPFVVHGGGLVAITHGFDERWTGQVFTRLNYNDFLFRIRPDPVLTVVAPQLAADARRRRDRDGLQIDAGTEIGYELKETRAGLRAGGSYERYEADGQDWGRHGIRTWVSIDQPLPADFHLHLRGWFTYHDYDHRSSHLVASAYVGGFGPKRRDRIWRGEAGLGYDITEWLEISARYQYLDNDSNTRIFDYDRHIIGGYLTLSWND